MEKPARWIQYCWSWLR